MMKNKLNRILSLAITIMMAISCFSITAFAESRTNHTYELYQIFKGTFSNGVLSDVQWGKNAKKPSGSEAAVDVDSAILKELEDLATATDSEKLATITKYVDFTSEPFKGKENQPEKALDSNEYTYKDIEPGYYIIRDAVGTQDTQNGVYTLYVVKASDTTLVFAPKESIPTVTKQINDNGLTSTNSASIGEDVNYVITGTLPSQISDYATYYYKFMDTLSAGLTYKEGSLKIYLQNASSKEDVTQYFYVKASAYNETTGTNIVVAIQDLKELANVTDVVYTIDSNTQVIIEYTATLNQNAVINAANTNEVYLVYSNDPNNSGTASSNPPSQNPTDEPTPNDPVGETVKPTTETYTTALVITKKNDQGEILQGAAFTLKGDAQTGIDVQGEVDAMGVLTFTGLGEGEYTLTETKTPAGYNTMEPITFKISFDSAQKTFSTDKVEITLKGNDGKLYTDIVNYPGSKLPSTGGIGTTIFYIVGSVLVVGAIVLLVVKNRMDRDDR